jgi:putative oxidoreductase
MIDRARLEEITYNALRIVAGLTYCLHGAQKFGVLTTNPLPATWSIQWFGGVIELVCGMLIALGLSTRAAAFLASGEMAVVYIGFHWKGALDAKFSPLLNGGEPSLIFCFLFLFIMFRGPGRLSVDRLLRRA